MPTDPNKPCLKVCETCPWLKKNQGKAHPAGWFTKKNIIRLWNGLRSGKAPGVVCHVSDPDSIHYGATVPVKPTVERRPCAGAILAVGKHIEEINVLTTTAGLPAKEAWARYEARHERPMTKRGLAYWVGEIMFGLVPDVEDRRDEIGFPWENNGGEKENKSEGLAKQAAGPSSPGH